MAAWVEPRHTCTRGCLTWGWGSGPASACRFSAGPGGGGRATTYVRAREDYLLGGAAADGRVLADLVAARGVGPRRTCTRRFHTWGCGSRPASACRFSGGPGGGGTATTYVRAREDSILGGGAADRRVLADLVPAPAGGGTATTYVRAREDSILGGAAADRPVLADLVAAPGGGRATTYVHEKIPYLGVGQRTGECLQIWCRPRGG